MEGTRIKGAVGVGLTLAVMVSLVAATGAAGVLAATSPGANDVQNQMNNSTTMNASENESANTSAPSPATMGTLNNSTMASMSTDELATRALELQRVLGPTQTQYLKQIRALELQLNAAQQQNGSNTTGVLPSANQSMANATVQGQGQTEGVVPLNNSTLQGMSHNQLEAQIIQLQQVVNQTQQQYLKQIRALQLQLNNTQNQSQGQASAPAPAPSNQTAQNETNAGHGGNGKAKSGNGKAKTGSGNQMG